MRGQMPTRAETGVKHDSNPRLTRLVLQKPVTNESSDQTLLIYRIELPTSLMTLAFSIPLYM